MEKIAHESPIVEKHETEIREKANPAKNFPWQLVSLFLTQVELRTAITTAQQVLKLRKDFSLHRLLNEFDFKNKGYLTDYELSEIFNRVGVGVTAKEIRLLSLSLKLDMISMAVLADILLPPNTNFEDNFDSSLSQPMSEQTWN